MNYTLAKELKDAGFRHQWSIDFENPAVQHDHPPRCRCLPTLSELIEACGNRFFALYAPGKLDAIQEWQAQEDSEFAPRITGGTTPEEAVARLWIALNPVINQEEKRGDNKWL